MIEIFNLLKKIYSFLGKNYKKKFTYVVFLNLIMGLLDVLTIASVIPVLSLFSSENETIEKFSYLLIELGLFKTNDLKFYSILLISITVLVFLLATLFRIFTILQINRFIEGVRHYLSVKILQRYMNKNYHEILMDDSSEIAKLILSEVDQFIVYVFRPAVLLISGVIVFILIFGFLIYSSPLGSFISVSLVLLFYISFFILVKKPLSTFGESSSNANELRFKYATEAFRSFKDIKVYSSEEYFTNRFKFPSYKFSRALSSYQTLETSPKYILEFIAFTGLMLVTIFIIIKTNTSNNSLTQLPILGTFAFGAYKSQPIISSIFHGVGSLKFGERIIKNINNQLNFHIKRNIEVNPIKYCEKYAISFEKVSYSYNQDNKEIKLFKDISLRFNNVGMFIICGPSGIGKSTILDLILGLIKPNKGKIHYFTKNKDNSKNINISYLHQDFNLYNSDIISNIAFGVSREDIKLEKVIKALEDVQMLSFVNSLPDKLNTILGENGKNLSGGQKQRIALARAIYFNPDILILDEPTSALDSKVENKIFKIIKNISKQKLVIMSTHKLSKIFENEMFIKINGANDIKFTSYKEIVG